jgi:hypothetical protein
MTKEPPPPGRTDKLLRLLIWVCLYAFPAAVALLPILDADIWWHLRAGQWVVEHRAVPGTDPFSQHGLESGKAWLAYSWLFEVLVYALYSGFGFAGLFLGRVVMTLAIVFALHRLVAKREPRFVVAAGLTGVAILGILPLLTDRPWLFTILFSTLTLDVILDLRAGKTNPVLWALPAMFVLWANLHIQFIYGLFLLVLACAAPLGDRLLSWPQPADGAATFGTRRWRFLAGVTVACFAATLLTPYHLHLYDVVRDHATQHVPLQQVAEMRALEFRDLWDWCVLALAGAGAFALGQRRRWSAFDWLLLIAAAGFAFRARRDVWFVVLAALAVVTTRQPRGEAVREFLPTLRQGLLVAGGVLPLLALFWCYGVGGDGLQKTLEATYPVKAVAFLKEQKREGPLFNHYDWGGYLIWSLPELPVSMDGRANLHGDRRMEQGEVTWEGQPGWDQDPDLVAARVVIAGVSSPLTSLLRQEKRFRVGYEDEVAVVFLVR